MTNRQLPYPALLLSAVAVIFVRQALGGQPAFRSEFLIEDVLLFLTLASAFAPARFKPPAWLLISCSLSITVAVVAWAIGVRKHALLPAIACAAVFALFAAHNAIRALIALSKLRKCRPAADSGERER